MARMDAGFPFFNPMQFQPMEEVPRSIPSVYGRAIPGIDSPVSYASGGNVGTSHLNNVTGRTDVLFIDSHVETLASAVWVETMCTVNGSEMIIKARPVQVKS